MIILGLETSCDETGVAIVGFDGVRSAPVLLGDALHSQISLHAAYGGVVPEIASRDHIRRIVPLTREALRRAGRDLAEVGAVAHVRGPGLAGALLVGAGAGTSLALALGKPAIGIHHLEGHLLSPFLSADAPSFPFVALLVSGGHTQLLDVTDVGRYRLLGDTIDDAAGEAFDKSAKLLGLGYPGGPALARLAEFGDPGGFELPRPLLKRGSLDFSFAGLKTAVRTHALRLGAGPACDQARADLAAAAQEAIVDVLAAKSLAALGATGRERLVVAGGVGANARLRERLSAAAAGEGSGSDAGRRRFRVHYPELALCTDNGAMIALAAAMRAQRGLIKPSPQSGAFDVKPRWPLAELSSG